MYVSVNSLTVTVAAKGGSQKELLSDVSFQIDSGDVVALMGPSGAGKTTMLNRLVGRGIIGEVSGAITYDGRALREARRSIGYVTQDDIMYETLTPRENLTYAVTFQQGHRPAAERREAVEAVLQKLRLVKCADTVVGTPGLVKGISGGERKRTNVAMSLLSNPRMLLLDEPTSGLDAKMADDLMADVREVAKQGCTVVATIHQPSEAVFERFKKVLLLESGRIAYYGPVAGLRHLVQSIGFPAAVKNSHVPLPELLLEVLEAPADKVDLESHSQRLAQLRSRGNEGSGGPAPASQQLSAAGAPGVRRLNFVRQVGVLFHRNLLNFRRNKLLTIVRLVQTVLSTVLISWIFNQVGSNMSGVQARMFGCFLLAFAQFLFAMLGVVNTFPAERAVFLREAQDRWYNPAAFYLAKVALDSITQCLFPVVATSIGYPIMGLNTQSVERVVWFYIFVALLSNSGAAVGFVVSAMVPSVNAALSITPGLVMPQLILCGLFIKVDLLPQPFRTISYVVIVRYALQGVLTNEFVCETKPECVPEVFRTVSGAACASSPCDFCCDDQEVKASAGVCPTLTCEEALRSLSLDGDTIWPAGDSNSTTVALNALALLGLLVLFRLLGMLALVAAYRRASKRG